MDITTQVVVATLMHHLFAIHSVAKDAIADLVDADVETSADAVALVVASVDAVADQIGLLLY